MENTLPPADILTKFQVCAPVFVEQTQIATIWKVRLLSGAPAALKIYNQQDMKNERTGFAFIEALAGDAAVKLLGLSQGEALLEWLDGPSLGDLTRSGQDQAANAELIRVAVQIHSLPRRVTAELPKLTDWFDALFQLEFDDTCPAEARRDIVFCQQTAQNLLANQIDIRPLHGDLHHDNIRLGARGYCAFDAKGVLGERAYELANAFRNPKGAEKIVTAPERVVSLAQSWSQAFDVDQQRLLQWAMVKVALSISWRCNGKLKHDGEFALLALFRAVMKRG